MFFYYLITHDKYIYTAYLAVCNARVSLFLSLTIRLYVVTSTPNINEEKKRKKKKKKKQFFNDVSKNRRITLSDSCKSMTK
jgi:hypothetical protein